MDLQSSAGSTTSKGTPIVRLLSNGNFKQTGVFTNGVSRASLAHVTEAPNKCISSVPSSPGIPNEYVLLRDACCDLRTLPLKQ